jgi:hypothetical protein
MSSNTQLTSAIGFNVSRMVFTEPQTGSIPNTVPAITFKRININVRNDDGSIGEFLIATERLFSFGVSENLDPSSQKVNGYVMPIVLWNRDNPTAEEKAFTDTFDAIIEKVKDHLLTESVKEQIDTRGDLERSDLKKLNPLHIKKVLGKPVPGASPTLYAKLLVSKKLDKITSMFYDHQSGEDINPLDLINKQCHVRAVIKIESIFIGNKISFQVKLHEAEVEPKQTGMRKYLSRPIARPVSDNVVTISNSVNNLQLNNDDTRSIKSDSDSDSDSETPTTGAPTPSPISAPVVEQTSTPAPRVVKKVTKK